MYFENMYYTKEGDGKTVLFLHGWGANGDCWQGIINPLKKRYCVVCVDFYGFGKSVLPPQGSDLSFYAEKISLLLDFLGVKKVNIVAHSFGGRVAILLTAKHPEKVEKLTLISSAGLKRFSLVKSLKILHYKIVKRFVKMKLVGAEKLKKFGSADFRALKGGLEGTFISVTQQDLSEFLPQIACPTLLIWGKKDNQTPLWIAEKMKRKIPLSELIFIGNGHFGAFENPTLTSAVLSSFID